ncbi:MAG: hypothetical protein M3Z84_10390 [Actinomycetota bacterium]|nr:hypothetical protein [Actinomycetota bacterium]
MPWCDACNEYRPANTLTETGACPDCDAVIGEAPKIPWHFKLLVLAIVIYLGWRAWQGIDWLLGNV